VHTLTPLTSHHPIPVPHPRIQPEALATATAGPALGESVRTPPDGGDQHPHADVPAIHAAAEAVMGNGVVTFDPKPHQYVQSAWAGTKIALIVLSAMKPSYGTNRSPHAAPETSMGGSSIRADKPYVGTSSVLADAPARIISTNVQDVVTPTTARRDAPAANQLLQRRRTKAVTPYRADGWQRLLSKYGLNHKYAPIVDQLLHGFSVRAPVIARSFTPPNNPSITLHQEAFNTIVYKEFEKDRYIGPFTRNQLERTIGFFQSSPLTIIPKAGKPGRFRLIQNLSYPNIPSHSGIPSINSQVDSDLFPCTWGTFATTCTLIHSLPPGCQGATHDVAEAYRTVPLHPSQWPALVVRIRENPPTFAVDTALCFGYGPSAGTYGSLRDVSLDIMRAAGIGPIIAWVDDHLFIRLPCNRVHEYNLTRSRQATAIRANSGPLQDGRRIWFKGQCLADGTHEEFAEDCQFPIQDMATASGFTFATEHVNFISDQLGIPWEPTKDTPFSSKPTFMGFEWDLENKTVVLTHGKRDKYLLAIKEWFKSAKHTLEDVQKLHGRLSHASLTIPEGSAYLTSLQAMLGIFGSNPFMPRTPPCGLTADLQWWCNALISSPPLPIPHHTHSLDLNAFSDASSGFGLAVTIGDRWRAWRLHKEWKRDERDIGWAESVAFEMLIRILLTIDSSSTPLTVYGDNQGVVEAWRKGCSNNKPTNRSFRRIHTILASPPRRVFTKYIPSKRNPADGPSRGKYPPTELALPRVPIPSDIAHLIFDFDDLHCSQFCIKN